MSTNTRPITNAASGGAATEEPAKPRIDLSLTQVLGGALAAMTAAFLGSRLSLAGTVVGAALASIIAAVAGSVYTASLRTTREHVRTVFRGRVAGTDLPASVTPVDDADQPGLTSAPVRSGTPASRASLLERLCWRSVGIAALAAFALAAVTLTGLELATGSALSGGDGTTITQVTEPRQAAEPTPTASASPTPTASTSPTATPSASEAPPATPEAQTPAAPEPTPEPSSPAPSASTPTPEPTPSTLETPAG